MGEGGLQDRQGQDHGGGDEQRDKQLRCQEDSADAEIPQQNRKFVLGEPLCTALRIN